jgi:hypothetical protein
MKKRRFFLMLVLIFYTVNIYGKLLYKIPFMFCGNRIYLQGLVNGKKCSLLYDTGAFGISIDKEFASENSIVESTLQSRKEIGVTIGDFNKRSIFYKIQDCKSIGSSIDNGIIGINFFENYLVEIDYSEHLLNIYSREEIPQGYTKLDAIWQKNIQFLGSFITNTTITFGDSTIYTGRFIIDTGSGRNISLLKHVPIKIKKDFCIWKGKSASHYGFNVSKVFKIDNFSFNNKNYYGLIADCSMDDNMEATTAIDGIIGGKFLRNFKIVVDFTGHAIYFKENLYQDGFVSNYIGDNIGYRDRINDLGGLLVVSILEHPSFPKNKIKLDDIIIEVNNVSVKSKEYNDIKKLFNIEGERITYKIKRGSKIFNVESEIKKIL